MSLARTHSDHKQYKDALSYYERELELRRGNPSEECDTWSSIAAVRDSAGWERHTVIEAYSEAYRCAQESQSVKLKVDVCRAAVQVCKWTKSLTGSEEIEKWEGELENLLAEHSDIPLDTVSDSESDSQSMEGEEGFLTPDSMSEIESVEEGEEEEEVVESAVALSSLTRRTRGVPERRKSRVRQKTRGD